LKQIPIEVDESMSIDHTKHSIFGASKVAADVMVQEYGRYFGMNTVVFRGGCLTGPNHQGAELHGFLAYLIKCIVTNKHYNVFGYKGKQVRDNIHSWDLVNMFWHYHQNPIPGAVYNAGGGRSNSTSILEAIDSVNQILSEKDSSHTPWNDYTILDDNRIGDHIWYISDLTKFKNDYPEWPGITISLEETIKQMVEFEISKLPVESVA
jgi:CDP-paratose 2-epimerase